MSCRSITDTQEGTCGRIICDGCPCTCRKTVRRLSCRSITQAKLCFRASRSTGPVSSKAAAMTCAAPPPSRWSSTQSRFCPGESGKGASRATRTPVGGPASAAHSRRASVGRSFRFPDLPRSQRPLSQGRGPALVALDRSIHRTSKSNRYGGPKAHPTFYPSTRQRRGACS